MRKSKEQMEAEQIVATLLRNKENILIKAKKYADTYKYIVAQRVTLAICLCTLYDFYTEMGEQDIKDFYQMYLAYHKSFNEGHEDIYKQMKAIDDILEGELMREGFFDAVKEEADARCDTLS